eukprot:366458-Chlamydomonas_euryale.AAC.4
MDALHAAALHVCGGEWGEGLRWVDACASGRLWTHHTCPTARPLARSPTHPPTHLSTRPPALAPFGKTNTWSRSCRLVHTNRALLPSAPVANTPLHEAAAPSTQPGRRSAQTPTQTAPGWLRPPGPTAQSWRAPPPRHRCHCHCSRRQCRARQPMPPPAGPRWHGPHRCGGRQHTRAHH